MDVNDDKHEMEKKFGSLIFNEEDCEGKTCLRGEIIELWCILLLYGMASLVA